MFNTETFMMRMKRKLQNIYEIQLKKTDQNDRLLSVVYFFTLSF